MVLKHDSEEEAAFLLSMSIELSQLDFYTLDSIAGLNSLSLRQSLGSFLTVRLVI